VSPEALDAVRVVTDEIQRLASLVTEFLDFARPQPLAKKELSLRGLCERVLRLVAQEARDAQVELIGDLPPQDVLVHADGPKLEQVLLNVVRNAIEALAPLGSGNVTLHARRQPRHAQVEIEDDGPGVTSPDAPIFDAFYSTKPNGTGLGLAIAHRIVSDHAGSIVAESRPGHTLFRITLPLDGSPVSKA
jgi:signal transduction histidine kinase